jgi:hypothetical protein
VSLRPFDLRDIALVRQLEEQYVPLDTRAALTEAQRPLHRALLAYLISGRGTPTFVLRGKRSGTEVRAFGQIQMHPRCHQAQLVAMAIDPPDQESLGLPEMLDTLTAYAGRCGAYTIVAEVEDSSAHFEVLRRADFVVYTRQEVWRLTSTPPEPDALKLRPEQESDQWSVQQLIANTVPRLIQQVDPPNRTGTGLVWMEGDEILAYVRAYCGQRGVWLQLYLHPQGEEAARTIIEQAAATYKPTADMPLYCCVRRYQEWLDGSLAELGFEPLGSQALLVRHTTARIRTAEHAFAAVHEKALEAPSPVTHSKAK